MTPNARRHALWMVPAAAIALLVMGLGTAMATVPGTTAHLFSSHPMISGTVVSVNDHQMVVDTDQGEQVTLQLDSRTMAPRDLAPGMVMRAEFLALEDCRYYVQRVMPIRGGTSADRFQAYANTRDSRETIERNASSTAGGRWNYRAAETAAGTREMAPQQIGEHSPGNIVKAVPSTQDHRFSTRPMLSGRVVSVNDHRLVLDTEQGQQVALVMDSQTLVPAEIAPGVMMRAEFTQMKDGRFHAARISQISSGTADREQAYAHTRDSDLALAQNIPDCGFVSIPNAATVSSDVDRREEKVPPPAPLVASVPAPVVAVPEPVVVAPAPVAATLPQTASAQPMVLLLGLLSLGSAGLLAWVRSRPSA